MHHQRSLTPIPSSQGWARELSLDYVVLENFSTVEAMKMLYLSKPLRLRLLYFSKL